MLKNLFCAENGRIAVEFFLGSVAKICQGEMELCAKTVKPHFNSFCACVHMYAHIPI